MEQAAYHKSFLRQIQMSTTEEQIVVEKEEEEHKNLDVLMAHPQFVSLVRNGRTSCKSPPMQQTPRNGTKVFSTFFFDCFCAGGFREIFRASPGKYLVTIDYKYIELCTLAIVCQFRYGHSVLADVITNGLDPHSFTAAMFEKVPFQTFLTWKNSPDKTLQEKFATLRQRAKAINFGIPSGLTTAGLSQYASSAYGIDLPLEVFNLFDFSSTGPSSSSTPSSAPFPPPSLSFSYSFCLGSRQIPSCAH